METSSDVSVNDKRTIPYNIEYSKDNGKTWEASYILAHVAAQGGYKVTYTEDGLFPAFADFKTASNAGSIVIRISTNDHTVLGSENGQYVNIHRLVITADLVADYISKINNRNLSFTLHERTIVAHSAPIKVLNTLGQVIGSGYTVKVPCSGLYIVQSSNNQIHKIIIQ